ncbi:MAG: sulfotransferase family 2 domain-containing protein [Alterinioella nitratireducens]|uniref:sulfotransferase family 2 domain-containing protein n=1 Tax=Alterinioella nitratireducens TaxID=2735915 RepID=UPI00405A30D7
MTPIIFLHIPKTAGQTIHSELTRMAGPARVSPIRVHSQAPDAAGQFPPGYDVYSGHLDWTELETLPEERFTFTVLRDPRERIASFYFYLLKEAATLSKAALQRPENTGKRRISTQSADAYFFAGPPPWRRFIHDHYDNVYCSYLATRKIRGWQQMKGLDPAARVAAAQANLPLIDRIYSTRGLDRLENDIEARTGKRLSLVGKYVNKGNYGDHEPRWPKLLARMESDANIARLQGFVAADEMLIADLDLTL